MLCCAAGIVLFQLVGTKPLIDAARSRLRNVSPLSAQRQHRLDRTALVLVGMPAMGQVSLLGASITLGIVGARRKQRVRAAAAAGITCVASAIGILLAFRDCVLLYVG
jgi:hypothetical protein